MLDGPGDFDKIRPRKNLLLRTLSKRPSAKPVLLPNLNDREWSCLGLMTILLSIIGIAFLIRLVVPLIFPQLFAEITPEQTALEMILFAILAVVVLLLSLPFGSKLLREYQHSKENEQRHWRHYMKKISRVEHEMAAGSDYKLGADGEIVLVKNTDKDESDTAMQINDAGELTHKKDGA